MRRAYKSTQASQFDLLFLYGSDFAFTDAPKPFERLEQARAHPAGTSLSSLGRGTFARRNGTCVP